MRPHALLMMMLGLLALVPGWARAQTPVCCMPTARNDGGDSASTGRDGSVAAVWNQMIAGDRQRVASGMLPPGVLKYDAEIATLLQHAQSILVAKDKARARAWSRDYNRAMSARSNLIIRYSKTETDNAKSIINTLGHGKPDPCLDNMGRNICSPPSRTSYPSEGENLCSRPIGSGPGGVIMGMMPCN